MNLFVGNLSPETNSEALRKLFSEFGDVLSSKVIIDIQTGVSKGFGFVEMADKITATSAIDNLDMTFFEGTVISVKEAKQSTPKGGGSYRPGQSSGSGGGYRPGQSSGAGGGSRRPHIPRTKPRPGGDFNSFNKNY